MGKLSIVTDSSGNPEKLKINVTDRKIYYGDSSGTTVLIEGTPRYRPLHCSELNNRLRNRNWNKSETLFISGSPNEDDPDPILCYRKYTDENNKPTGEIDTIDTFGNDTSLSFPLCGPSLQESTKLLISEEYQHIFDTTDGALEEVCFMWSSKNVFDVSLGGQISIELVKGFDSYTSSLSLHELIEYSSYPGTSARVDLSVKYSKISDSGTDANIYSYFTTFTAFEYTKEDGLVLENIIDDIEDLVRIEYLGGIIRIFAISPRITECIIDNCTIVYGNFK